MTPYSPMEDEKRINKVLAYQAKQLDEIEVPDTSSRLTRRITETPPNGSKGYLPTTTGCCPSDTTLFSVSCSALPTSSRGE